MSLQKRRLRHLFWVFFEKFGVVGLSIVSFLLYAKFLTPAELGIGVLLLSLVELASRFLITIVDNSMIRLETITEQNDGTAFWSLLFVSLIFSLILFACYSLYFEKASIVLAGAIAVLLIPLQAMSRVHIVHLRRRKAFRQLANRAIVGKIVGMSAGIACAVKGFGEFALVTQSVIMSLTSTVLLFVAEKRHLPFVFDKLWIKEQLSIGVPASLKVMNQSVYSKGVIILIELFLGTAALGYYNFAYRMVELPRGAIVGALMGYANPVFSMRARQGENVNAFFLQCTKLGLIFFLPLFFGLSLIAHDMLFVLFGDKWLPSATLLSGIAILTAFNTLFLFLPSLLVALGKTRRALNGQIFSTFASLIILLVLLPNLGLLAVLVALSVRVIIMVAVNMHATLTVLGMSYMALVRPMSVGLVASLMMWGCVNLFQYSIVLHDTYTSLLANMLFGCGIYIAVLIILNRQIVSEVGQFLSKK
jgi:O-antigen/teichoic acid export membrane protein